VSNKENIRKNILSTIIYYNVLNFPLTSFEVWKYLTIGNEKKETGNDKQSCSLSDVVEILEDKELEKHIEEFRGFYFLKGRKDLVEQRLQNDKNSIVKYKIAKKVAKWLGEVPFVRMIAVTGTVAMRNSEKGSDIDFLVVLKKGRIWTGRLLVTLAVQLLGRRRHGKKVKNRICLNYFITTESLRIKRQDLFAANEYSFIYTIFDSEAVISSEEEGSRGISRNKILANPAISTQISLRVPINQNLIEVTKSKSGVTKKSIFSEFGEANIDWIKKYKPNFEFPGVLEIKPLRKSRQAFFEGLIDLFGGDRIEAWLKRKQIEKIKRNPLTYKKGGYIEYTDENLIFLPEPQGPSVLEKYRVLTSQKDFL